MVGIPLPKDHLILRAGSESDGEYNYDSHCRYTVKNLKKLQTTIMLVHVIETPTRQSCKSVFKFVNNFVVLKILPYLNKIVLYCIELS